jgi:hypothetical protein
MPKIREFRTSDSILLTKRLLHPKKQDGPPAFIFMNFRRLSICLEDIQNIRYLLQNAKLLEKLHLSSAAFDQTSEGFHDFFSASAGTSSLKVLDLTLVLYNENNLPFEGLCEELEAMVGHNRLETLSLEVNCDMY